MRTENTINLGNLLLSLSNAADLANTKIAQHQQRTAYIALEICKTAGVSEKVTADIFMAALMHDLGAITISETKSMDNFETLNTDDHCLRGELLLRRIPEFQRVAKIVRNHHTPWTSLRELPESDSVLSSQILMLADNIERMINTGKYILHQTDEITDRVRKLGGVEIDPVLIKIFLEFSHREEFWLDIISPRLYSLLFHTGPLHSIEVNYQIIENISKLFRDIIDYKSPFTATHTSGVSASAEMISKLFGLTDVEIQEVKIAGNFHDLGKLVVPNSILDKPGKLTKEEYEIIKCHSYYTYYTINSIEGLEHIAEWAAYHHEKLDGSGYPFHYDKNDITIFSRIIAVADIFTAVSEHRPYRKKMEKEEIIKFLSGLSKDNLIDSKVVELLFDNYDSISEHVSIIQELSSEFYNTRLNGV
ncbi:MAG: HD domain-containing protein [Spirochaetes bacterium]|nr:HD domain-containing protein [Spirochaetota bacterium]